MIVDVHFEVNNVGSKMMGNPSPEPWCEEQGDHQFTIDFRGICRATSLDNDDFEFYKFQAETQLGTDCGGQQLGICRVLRVSKHGTPLQWVESQDGPEGDLSHGPGGPGGSMEETSDGQLVLKWETCPEYFKIDYVVSVSSDDMVV